MKHLIQKVSLGNTINIIDLQRRNSLKKKQTHVCCILIVENQGEQSKYRKHFD